MHRVLVRLDACSPCCVDGLRRLLQATGREPDVGPHPI